MRYLTLMAPAFAALACTAEPDPPSDPEPAGQPDIYVAILTDGPGGPVVGEITNVTDRAGYDNQPHFTPDGTGLLFTSQRDGQTDIYRFDGSHGTIDQITRTAESEYSATVMPDGRTFSVIQVEADSTQRLWSFDFEGANHGVVFEHIKPVGYHAWAGPTAVAMFVLPVDSQGITLHLADPTTGADRIVTTAIGRSLQNIPGRGTISYVDKSDSSWTINELDPVTGATRVLTETIDGSEDHAWLPDGSIVMGAGSVLHRWTPDGGWQVMADVADRGIVNISRLAVHPSGRSLALVADGT